MILSVLGLLTEDHKSFFRAASTGDLKTIKQLIIRNKIDINITNQEGRTALMIASLEGHVDIVILLLDNGASVNMQDKNGWSALMYASYVGSIDVIKVLLERNAEVNLQNSMKWSALFIACHRGNVEAGRLLFEKGAEVDFQNDKGVSPLMDASSQNHIELLLEKKAQQSCGKIYPPEKNHNHTATSKELDFHQEPQLPAMQPSVD